MTTENGSRTMRVQWHPDAIELAVQHAKATRDGQPDDVDWDKPIHYNLPLTWKDLAALVDVARALESERLDFATNAATMGHVQDRLTDLLLEYDKQPENLAAAVDDVRTTVDTLAWLHAEAMHHAQLHRAQAQAQRENESQGYLDHRAALIDALGQHANPLERTLMALITEDVADVVQSYDTVHNELVEWRTGQRAVEASAAQWVQIQSTLDETLATVRQLAGHLGEDAQREQLRGELPTTGDLCPLVVSGDDEHEFSCDQPAAPGLPVCPSHADGPVTETTAEPVRFTHDDEE